MGAESFSAPLFVQKKRHNDGALHRTNGKKERLLAPFLLHILGIRLIGSSACRVLVLCSAKRIKNGKNQAKNRVEEVEIRRDDGKDDVEHGNGDHGDAKAHADFRFFRLFAVYNSHDAGNEVDNHGGAGEKDGHKQKHAQCAKGKSRCEKDKGWDKNNQTDDAKDDQQNSHNQQKCFARCVCLIHDKELL